MLFQHRQDLVQAIGADARGGAARAGVAGGAHQRLQLHHQGPGALAGHDRGRAGAGFITTEEQLAGVGDLSQAPVAHFKYPQLVGRPKTIFGRPQQAVAGKAIPLKGEHRIHQVLEHLGARQHALLGHMAHEQKGGVLAFGNPGQGRSALPHLGHGARGATELGVVQGLDAVDDGHRWPQGLEFLQHQLQVGFGQQLEISPLSSGDLCSGNFSQPAPAQLHLLGRFLRTHVEHRGAPSHGAAALQQQGGFADAGIPAQQHQRARHQPPTQDPIKFAVARGQALQGPLPHRLDRLRALWPPRACLRLVGHGPPPAAIGSWCGRLQLFHQAVPAATAGTFAKKLTGLGPATGANKNGAGFSHRGLGLAKGIGIGATAL